MVLTNSLKLWMTIFKRNADIAHIFDEPCDILLHTRGVTFYSKFLGYLYYDFILYAYLK